jgi:hypothetical protein
MATPWWDFFSHCKEAAESDSEDDHFQNNDDTSYADFNNDGCVTNSANDDDDLTINSAPHSPASIVRTPLKLISTQSNDTADVDNYDAEAARPDTPATHDSSFETSSSSPSHYEDDDDDVSSASSSSSSLPSIELNKEEQEECNFNGEVTPGSLVSSPQVSSSLKLVTTSSVAVMSPPKDVATPYNIKQQLLQLQSISEEEDCEEQDDDDEDTITITYSNSDDDYYNFIGEIEIMPISPLLSTHQRNIRKNAYNLLKRLGEKESLFDVNSVEVDEQDDEEGDAYERQQRQMELQEEVDELKRKLGECTDMVLRLQDNLRSYSKDTTSSKEIIKEDDDNNKEDDKTEQLLAEIAKLTRQLQSTSIQTAQDAQQIQSLEAKLQHALHESSHHLDKMQEYEEKIDSLNEAVVRSYLYNEEIVKELMILRKENDDLRTRLVDDGKKREEETEDEKNEFLSLEGEANASPSIAAAAGGATDKASEASFEDTVVDGGDDDATTVWGHVPSVFHDYEQQPRSTLQDHPLSCTKQGATPTWFWPLAGSILICVSIINFRGNDVTILMNQAYIAAFHMGGVMYHNRLEHHPASGVGPGMFVILAFAVACMRAQIWMVFGGLLLCYALAVGLTKVSVKPATAFDDGSGES